MIIKIGNVSPLRGMLKSVTHLYVRRAGFNGLMESER